MENKMMFEVGQLVKFKKDGKGRLLNGSIEEIFEDGGFAVSRMVDGTEYVTFEKEVFI